MTETTTMMRDAAAQAIRDGGSIRRARPLLHTLIRLADRFPEGKLFVVTSPRTFSAPVLLAVEKLLLPELGHQDHEESSYSASQGCPS